MTVRTIRLVVLIMQQKVFFKRKQTIYRIGFFLETKHVLYFRVGAFKTNLYKLLRYCQIKYKLFLLIYIGALKTHQTVCNLLIFIHLVLNNLLN